MAIAAADDGHASDDAGDRGFKLVGFKNFVRRNPRSDRFPVRRFHHLEFWTSDATNAARRFSYGLGIPLVAKSDLSTGNFAHASYLLRSSQLQFVFSGAYSPAAKSGATAAIPSFSVPEFRNFATSHGLAVRAVAFEVADAADAYRISVANGARPAHPPVPVGGAGDGKMAEISLFGDVVLQFVSLRSESEFLPGFESVEAGVGAGAADFGLRRLDHAIGNVPELAPAVDARAVDNRRPTIFLEIIQRVGCMVKAEEGRTYQKGGCGGFGKGNISELFKSIEEFEKSLEAKANAKIDPTG